MNTAYASTLPALLAVFLAAGTVPAQEPPPADLAGYKEQFDGSLRRLQMRGDQAVDGICRQYLDALNRLETSLQERGDLQSVILVRDEKARFEQAQKIPDDALAEDPASLKDAQAKYREQYDVLKKEKASKIVLLSERYMQDLTALERTLTNLGNAEAAAKVKAEREALLNNAAVREAIALNRQKKPGPAPAPAAAAPTEEKPAEETPAEPAAPKPAPAATTSAVPAYTFYKPGTEPAVSSKDIRKLQLSFTSPQSRAAGAAFSMSASVVTSKEQLQTSKDVGQSWYTKSAQGTVFYKPRVTILARNKGIDATSKLIVEYFSKSIDEQDRQKDCVESIVLPAVPQGQGVVVDAKGIGLYKFEYESNWGVGGQKSKRGREFYGLILSIYKPDGSLLFQQVSSQALDKEASPTVPLEKPCPQGPPAPAPAPAPAR